MSKTQQEQELEAECGRLEGEIATVKRQTAEVKRKIAEKEREIAQAEYKRSPEYEAELRQRLLVLDHRDAFYNVAETAGFVSLNARDAAWKILLRDGHYVVAGPPAKAAIEHAIAKFRETEDYFFSASSTASPERWNPAGPPLVFTTSNGETH